MTTSEQLRTAFLRFFGDRDHEIVPSSPLVPADDATLLFTNAGMVQFKEAFLGHETRVFPRAVSSQRCVRAGGKHNDLENVGYTARHHTFFEMLGNFSFGDYFKREAIDYAWTFLTKELALPPERLWITVFREDDESADIWLNEIGVSPKRFSRCGAEDNFWSMGETGPCGPCSEIFYDHGAGIPGGPPGSPDQDGDRYVEIWNLVFMQFNRDAKGNLTPLPRPSVDTGMGLERLAAVSQGVHSTFETDLFRHLVAAAADIVGTQSVHGQTTHPISPDDKSLRVIADHIRSSAFLITDGVYPANEGRGYVLRRIIRRAIRHGHRLGAREPFFFRLVAALSREMGEAYPELADQRALVARVLRQEEERFLETLDQGMTVLEQVIGELDGHVIPGEAAFRLYDTYGFPLDLTADVARERGLSLDDAGFRREMEKQRERARASHRFSAGAMGGEGFEAFALEGTPCEFTGYDQVAGDAEIVAIHVMPSHDGAGKGSGDRKPTAASEKHQTDRLEAGQSGLIVLDRTPFYAESGGQIGDRGMLSVENSSTGNIRFTVLDTKRHGKTIVHLGKMVEGVLRVGDPIQARVNPARRLATARGHSATHLLHAALRETLGDHVAQKGSLVTPDRLRFDFSHFEPVQDQQLRAIEGRVCQWVMENLQVTTRLMPLKAAMAAGVLALFGEKYEENVRVLAIGRRSTELCGGTHVDRSGDIGPFRIVSETGVAAGVRRIEALTGNGALDWMGRGQERLARISSLLKGDPDKIEDKLEQLLARNRELTRELEKLTAKLATRQGGELAARAVAVDGIRVLATRLENVDPKSLRDTVDQLKGKLAPAAIVLATTQGKKIHLVAGVTPDCTNRLPAKSLVNFVAKQVGGKGGGRPDMAQGGGDDPSRLDTALNSVPGWVAEQLSVTDT
uniref:Alanine--tRNA ligase n=1 Tax=Candidatus Kentrum eta TaxID=2126337 RepID=A0A450U8W8_9GAMM|nr:MAG: alanyl-tRNA synthetase [Candidatus Kentron sp. H]VFJ92803.1 MAG: alanyl-tRNA synthetase [Candidatus Kentron sp. H]VFJ94768.1 MAG: alanyl-tRNA synthetase [Candidatus Kentron sp. H]